MERLWVYVGTGSLGWKKGLMSRFLCMSKGPLASLRARMGRFETTSSMGQAWNFEIRDPASTEGDLLRDGEGAGEMKDCEDNHCCLAELPAFHPGSEYSKSLKQVKGQYVQSTGKVHGLGILHQSNYKD